MSRFEGQVFGPPAKDTLVFLGPVLFALLFGMSLFFIFPEGPPYWSLPFLMVAFDTPHFIGGVLYATHSPFSGTLKNVVFLLIIFWIAAFWILFNFVQDFALTFFAAISMWHFIKQHQAWFFLATRGTKNNWTMKINKLAINAATYGFVIIGLCGDEVYGWFAMNDIVLLPPWLKIYATIGVTLALSIYVIRHLYLFMKSGKTTLSGHIVMLSAVLVWGLSRLLQSLYVSAALIIIPHAVIYIYLMILSSKNSLKKTYGFSPVAAILTFCMIGGLYQFLIYWSVGNWVTEIPVWVKAFTAGISTAHYFQDKIVWNSKTNPGWGANVISPETVRTF